jgi:hypothetical protein
MKINLTNLFLHKSATVKLGEHNLETEIDCENGFCAEKPQIIYPRKVFLPKEYDLDEINHDIAIVELNEPANITRFVSPICLPTGDLIADNLMSQVVEIVSF